MICFETFPCLTTYKNTCRNSGSNHNKHYIICRNYMLKKHTRKIQGGLSAMQRGQHRSATIGNYNPLLTIYCTDLNKRHFLREGQAPAIHLISILYPSYIHLISTLLFNTQCTMYNAPWNLNKRT